MHRIRNRSCQINHRHKIRKKQQNPSRKSLRIKRFRKLLKISLLNKLTQEPKAGADFKADITLHNCGFAAPANKRDVELIFVSVADPDKKFIYPQTADPRFWMAGEKRIVNLACTLDANMSGEYKVYLNLPDPYASLHNDPRYSIRLANENMWEEATGYNYLTTVTID